MENSAAGVYAGEQKTRFIYPRHMDYWHDVFGYGDDPDAPCLAEFACCGKEAEDPLAFEELYHFEVVNTRGARLVFDELDRSGSWSDELKRTDFERQLELLEAGEISYFIGCFYFPAEPRFLGAAKQLPAGKTLFDCVNQNGVPSYYAVLCVREGAPLTPDVLCAQMEKLSPALFGDQSAYRIPESCIPARKAVETYYI